jgi:hypothetical protein
VTHPTGARLCLVGTLACSLFLTGCESRQDLVDRQHKVLTSLRSSVASVCHGWLDGKLSTTYSRTALEAVGVLLEKERTRISASPDAIADTAVASISDAQHRLARQIALLRQALAESNADAIRQLMPAIEVGRSELP